MPLPNPNITVDSKREHSDNKHDSASRLWNVLRGNRLNAKCGTYAVCSAHPAVLDQGGRAACAKIRLASRPSDASLQEIMAFDGEVLHVDLVTLPNLA